MLLYINYITLWAPTLLCLNKVQTLYYHLLQEAFLNDLLDVGWIFSSLSLFLCFLWYSIHLCYVVLFWLLPWFIISIPILFWGHTQQYSTFASLSALWNHSWQFLWSHMWCQGSNLGWPTCKTASSLTQCYLGILYKCLAQTLEQRTKWVDFNSNIRASLEN